MVPAARKSVCVLGGSRFGSDPAYTAAAVALGSAVAAAGFRLVYGAGEAGLVAAAARAAADAGGATLGIVPAHLARDDLRDVVVTETLHERKKVMFMNADAFVALPGGAGTLDLVVEILTWRQLGLHRKPLHLLNVAGYWDPLRALLDHIVAGAFAEPPLVQDIETFGTVDDLVERLSAALYRRPLAAS